MELISHLVDSNHSVISQHNVSVRDLGNFPASAGTLTYAATWPHSNSYCASSNWCLLLPRSKPVEAKLMPQHVVSQHAVHCMMSNVEAVITEPTFIYISNSINHQDNC
jgi:hypothetical protein